MEVDLNDIALSTLRWSIGLSVGCLAGLIFALVSNYIFLKKPSRILNDYLRAIPIIGLVPVIQMNIGINEYGKIGLIAWAVLFPVWITVRNSLNVEFENCELMLRSSKKSSYQFFSFYTLPKIFSGFLKGVELAIGIAWLAVVAAEWVGTYTKGFWAGGLGYKLILGYEINNWNMVHMNLLTFGLLGFVSAYSWRFLVKALFIGRGTFNPILKSGE